MASAISKTISTTLLSPFRVTTLRLQCQGENEKVTVAHKGSFSLFSKIIREEGSRAFLKGNLINISKELLAFAAGIYFQNVFKGVFVTNPNDRFSKVFLMNIMSGLAVGACELSLTYSLEYAHTRLVNDVDGKKFTGVVDVYVQTYKKEGVRGLYRGFLVGCLGIAVIEPFISDSMVLSCISLVKN